MFDFKNYYLSMHGRIASYWGYGQISDDQSNLSGNTYRSHPSQSDRPWLRTALPMKTTSRSSSLRSCLATRSLSRVLQKVLPLHSSWSESAAHYSTEGHRSSVDTGAMGISSALCRDVHQLRASRRTVSDGSEAISVAHGHTSNQLS